MEEELSTKKKVTYILGFFLCLYLFIFSIALIKYSFSELGEFVIKITKNDLSEINAVGIGWLLAIIMQSSGAAMSAIISLNYAGIIGPIVMIFMVLGTRIGTTITSLFTATLVSARRRDFRHGFEIGLANLVYAFPILIIMFTLEYLFSFFSKTGNYFMTLGIPFRLGFIDYITLPIIKLLDILTPNYILAILGVGILIVSIKFMPSFMLKLWGEKYLKKKINKYMKKKHLSFLIGLGIALVLTSTSITITLLIPLIVSRLVNLKKVIPYIIGTNLGGVMDGIIGGLVVGETSIPAIFAYVSFSLIGLLWLFNTDLMFKITKYISKRTLQVSRKRAIIFVLSFILLAIILCFI